ncbi:MULTISPECIES: hypothetical protein [Rhizobium]|uniref:hypothetical protein n=1 Tax=Rhizobium TaxID=379 RepID=UPI00195AD818|nr:MULTISPECIES: hypothetical protein [Rhizobium]MBM7047169.1 hypothetical protein [Rhizobium lusitanum]
MRRFVEKLAVSTGGDGDIESTISNRPADEGALVVVTDANAAAVEVAATIETRGGRLPLPVA